MTVREVQPHEFPMKADFQNAIDVQDACNLSGVVFSFAVVMQKICNQAVAEGKGTDWKNQHPIAIMFAEKIQSLASNDCYLAGNEAWKICKNISFCDTLKSTDSISPKTMEQFK
jgi:hypothetical protein